MPPASQQSISVRSDPGCDAVELRFSFTRFCCHRRCTSPNSRCFPSLTTWITWSNIKCHEKSSTNWQQKQNPHFKRKKKKSKLPDRCTEGLRKEFQQCLQHPLPREILNKLLPITIFYTSDHFYKMLKCVHQSQQHVIQYWRLLAASKTFSAHPKQRVHQVQAPSLS